MSPEPPLDATGIARRQFSTARKGYDPAEVRGYLHELAEVVGRLQRGEAHEHERAERAENRAQLAERLDEHRLVELLGEETARVLEAARDAAGDIRSRAEESAARMVREAQVNARAIVEQADNDAAARRIELLAEADSLRREAEDEVERRRVEGRIIVDDMRRQAEAERERMLADGERARTEAEAAAEQIRASAREQGRRLVGEAQAVRERMLGDLSRRRRTAREQLERLNGARERLLAAYEVVKRTVDEATTELNVALPEAKLASEAAMRRVSDEPEESVEVLEAELSVARMAGLVEDAAATAVSDDELDSLLREFADDEAARAATGSGDGSGEGGSDESDAPDGASGDRVADDPEADTARVATGDIGRDDESGTEVSGRSIDGAAKADIADETVGEDAPGDVTPTATATSADDPEAAGGAQPPIDGPLTGGEKWGIRLPRPRPSASQQLADPDTREVIAAPSPSAGGPPGGPDLAPAPVTAQAAEAPVAGTATVDEGESGPYVDELFARIRAERGSGDAPSDQAGRSAEAAVGDENGAVAVAARPEGEVDARRGQTAGSAVPGDASVEPQPAAGQSAEADVDADTKAEAEATELDPVVWLLHQRDELLSTAERELGRRLKRVLADEQNEVLDMLRRGGTIEFSEVIPVADEHADRYAIAATADLDAAAAHGAALAGGGEATSCDELAGALGRTLVEPLRARIQRSFDDCDGDVEEVTERLRALYREWKSQHIGAAVRHYTASAYAHGAYDAAPPGAALRWLVDKSCEACPDCDDNALAGQVTKGEAFPTGDGLAPAHPDCRCLVVSVGTFDAG